jgi:hypothetical protein
VNRRRATLPLAVTAVAVIVVLVIGASCDDDQPAGLDCDSYRFPSAA